MPERITRRRLIGRGATLAAVASGLSGALAACGIEGTNEQSLAELKRQADAVDHPRVELGDWTFANWPLYMDKALTKEFDRRFGGRVKYVEEVNDNNDFFGKVRQQLAAGQPTGRDLAVLSDWMVARRIRNGWVVPIDRRNVPNARNLETGLANPDWDPQRRFSLPYQSGAVGIGYDIEQTGRELRSLRDLFDPEWKGRVTFLAEPYDAAGSVLAMQGKDSTKATLDDELEAIEFIGAANDKGQFRRFTGNDYTTDLAKGNIVAALAYSGDMVQLQSDNPNLRFSYAEEGAVLFTDNLLMPAKAGNPYAAEVMMNYLYDPQVAARLCAYVNYISPVRGIREILEREDPEIAQNPLIFPPEEVRATLQPYPFFTAREEQTMNEAMAKVAGA
ncbi:polyamine ABC transporter substrate-binding protein [Conexibacter woesei]|uniref:Extracellular solute-binding protein family 1 n=1 Tax=Conexibacter woesei (strain DSM 14684 / CCUG 47730 / CIP 108061 / JCM 11494 / NBRC 100937 / ID131577) TaxID=469383 RepID=D3F6P4_CONWI|nr:spermidine/putrescine ABC transporter substrate-binding protein [Conexibacter woesei]ADB52692.1 extracellular solute-binding protein family 1 [Conexibacter woesei DSM 14684]